MPSGQLSNVPWRKADVKYTNNEAYFDIIEEVDAIIDKQGIKVFELFIPTTPFHSIFLGSVVFAEIAGKIECCVRLRYI